MAKRKFFFLFILFVALIVSLSCSKEQEQKVDQQYLNSQDYSAFKESTDEELKRNDDSENLADDLVEISDCGSTTNLESPFSLDWEIVKKLTAGKEVEPCSIEREGQRLILAGVQSFGTQTVRWFLLEHQSAYRDAEVITATFSGNELRSFNTVGIYEQIPARSIHTNISVDNKGNMIFIRSETIRDIKYPLEQKNTITTEYEIVPNGSISEL
jgi:hypothetical protein